MAKPSPNSRLGASLTVKIDGSRVALAGNIDESVKLDPVLGVPDPIEIDLSGIQRINSLGVRTWTMFVRECELAGKTLSFVRCSPIMVQQLGMIASFIGKRSQLRSILVPYHCAKCSHEELTVVEIPSPKGPLQIAGSMRCPKCQAAMELDEVAELYTTISEELASR